MLNSIKEAVVFISTFLDPLGIMGGLFFSAIAVRNDVRSRRLENQIKITEGYRSIWSALIQNPALERVRQGNVDLAKNPMSPAEDRFVRFVVQNMHLTFEGHRIGQLGDIGHFEKDVQEFMSRPIPREVWKEIARFQPEKFRGFVEGLM